MCVVEVETDEGFTGIGWCEDYCEATSRMVEHHLSHFLIGADPHDRTVLWDQMFRASIPYGRKGAALYGISALDIALWDLAGKSCNQPVYQLLGGKVRDSIPAYASPPALREHAGFLRRGRRLCRTGLPSYEDAVSVGSG